MMLELDQSGALDGGRYTFKMGFLRNRQKESLATSLGPNMSGFYGIGEYRWQTGPLHWGPFSREVERQNPSIQCPGMLGAVCGWQGLSLAPRKTPCLYGLFDQGTCRSPKYAFNAQVQLSHTTLKNGTIFHSALLVAHWSANPL